MKKILIIAVIALFTACSTFKVTDSARDRKVFVSFFDFSKYSKAGFFISLNPYPGNFDPIGMIQVNIYPARVKKTIESKEDENGFMTKEYEVFTDEVIKPDELLDLICNKAKELGADGLVNFDDIEDYETHITQIGSYKTFRCHILKGFAIKRKN
jgi:hypothetical protein